MRTKILISSLVCLLCIALTSCGFVSFVRNEDGALASTKEEYIAILRAYGEENEYFEEERREYVKLLLEVENRIREAGSLEEILSLFEEFSEILGNIPLNIELTREKVYLEILRLSEENVYRKEQQESVEWLIRYIKDLIDNSTDIDKCEALIVEFKTRLGYIKTDAQLRAEELAALKKELALEFGTTFDYSLYRAAERELLEATVKEFQVKIASAATSEECSDIFSSYAKAMVKVPTSVDLLKTEREEWVTLWQKRLSDFARKYSLEIDSDIAQTLLLIAKQESAFGADLCGSSFVIDAAKTVGDRALEDMKNAASEYISALADERDYRADEADEVKAIKRVAQDNVLFTKTSDELLDILKNTENQIRAIATNEELWQKEDAEFARYMSDKYGSFALAPPDSLTVAKSTEELARIIDYYAFYQLDGESFERDVFRVKLDFAHNFADYIIKDVYWCCELLRSAVGISGEFDRDTSELIITLHPYELATLRNENKLEGKPRYDSLIEYNSNSKLTDRAEDFSAFPYLEKYAGRYVTVWNSQQLWYALEKEYIPVPVENSPAETVLKKAEEILREIIKDGMSIEEKVFAIYSWYSDNVCYDYSYDEYVKVEDRDNFPDSAVASLRSFHAEGALLDKLAVCCSYAKSTLILMRMEGIEAYRVILHDYKENAINNLHRDGYGSHAIITFRASDDKFYYCDTEQCAAGDNLMYEKYMQVMVTAKEQSPYNSCIDRIWTDLDYNEKFPMKLLWDNLTYNGKSVFVNSEKELKAIIDEFCKQGDKTKQINIFNYSDDNFNIGDLLDNDSRIEYYYAVFNDFYEYMISYVGDDG